MKFSHIPHGTAIMLSASDLLKKGFRQRVPSIVKYPQVFIRLPSCAVCSQNAQRSLFSSVSPVSGTRAWYTACVQ